MHAIELVGLDTHVPGPEVLHPTLPCLLPHRLLEDLEGLVPLSHDPLVRFERPCRIGRDEESWPDGPLSSEVGCGGKRVGVDAIEPVDSCLEVEVVPEAVAKDEGVGVCGLGWREEGFEARDFGGIEGKFEHQFDDKVDLATATGEGFRVVVFDVRGLVDALERAFFDVKLLVAEAFFAVKGSKYGRR